jgi:hypothetical protein
MQRSTDLPMSIIKTSVLNCQCSITWSDYAKIDAPHSGAKLQSILAIEVDTIWTPGACAKYKNRFFIDINSVCFYIIYRSQNDRTITKGEAIVRHMKYLQRSFPGFSV